MSRTRTLAIMGVLLALTGCGGGAAAPSTPAATTPGASEPAASTPAASEPAVSAPPASEPATGSACAPTSDPATVEAAMADFAFQPATINASVGEVIAWTNGDAAPHTATLQDDPACTTPNLARGETGALVFSAPGTYPFFCRIHPSMTGTIEITG